MDSARRGGHRHCRSPSPGTYHERMAPANPARADSHDTEWMRLGPDDEDFAVQARSGWALSRERGHPPPPPCGGRLACLNNCGPSAHCGRDARAPRTRHVRGRVPDPRERGHPPPPPCGGRLARLNTRVGLRPTCGRDARAPRKIRSATANPFMPRGDQPDHERMGPFRSAPRSNRVQSGVKACPDTCLLPDRR